MERWKVVAKLQIRVLRGGGGGGGESRGHGDLAVGFSFDMARGRAGEQSSKAAGARGGGSPCNVAWRLLEHTKDSLVCKSQKSVPMPKDMQRLPGHAKSSCSRTKAQGPCKFPRARKDFFGMHTQAQGRQAMNSCFRCSPPPFVRADLPYAHQWQCSIANNSWAQHKGPHPAYLSACEGSKARIGF
eukprot:1157893-Pelagomonas_calceolata.AAC.6